MAVKENFSHDCPYVGRPCNSWCRAYVEPNGKIPGYCSRLRSEENVGEFLYEISQRLLVLAGDGK